MSEPRYAGFWKRAVATLIDGALMTLLSSALEFAGCGVVYGFRALVLHADQGPFSDAFDPFVLQMVNLALYLAVSIPYYVIGQYRYGTTLGKRPFRIYVVKAKDLTPISLGQAWGRLFASYLSEAIVGAGFMMAAFNSRRQALHDLLAQTVSVIRPEGYRSQRADP